MQSTSVDLSYETAIDCRVFVGVVAVLLYFVFV